MPQQVKQLQCRTCGGPRPFNRKTCNHILHLLITLFLFGLWLPVWILMAFSPGPWLCTTCGSRDRASVVTDAVTKLPLYAIIVALAGVVGWWYFVR